MEVHQNPDVSALYSREVSATGEQRQVHLAAKTSQVSNFVLHNQPEVISLIQRQMSCSDLKPFNDNSSEVSQAFLNQCVVAVRRDIAENMSPPPIPPLPPEEDDDAPASAS